MVGQLLLLVRLLLPMFCWTYLDQSITRLISHRHSLAGNGQDGDADGGGLSDRRSHDDGSRVSVKKLEKE